MIVDTLITSVKKYFTSLSVDSMWGYKKVSLMEADDSKFPTGLEITIDATSSADISISKTLMQHSSESKKVYMDGTRINPVKMTLRGHLDISKLADIQRLASDDKWMYVSMTKDMGGSYVSMSKETLKQPQRLLSQLGLSDDSASQLYSDSKLYVIQNLSLSDVGYINTVEVTIDLVEVVMFDFDRQYKYGVKQSKGGKGGGKIQNTSTKEVDAPRRENIIRFWRYK